MIYLFYGSDVEKARAKAFLWVAAAREKEPNLTYTRLAREEITEAALEEAAAAGSLFAKRTLTLLDDPFASLKKSDEEGEGEEKTGIAALVEEKLPLLAESKNVIVLLAPKLAEARAQKIAVRAERAYAFQKAATGEERGFNAALVNALGAGDGKKLWLEIVRAKEAGDAPEALHGLLHWKARDLIEKGSRTHSSQKARELSLALIALLQNTRRRGGDLYESLERFALAL